MTKKYNLYLDDYRHPLKSLFDTGHKYYMLDWDIVKTYDEFVDHIKINGIPEICSFDHDLADEHYKNQTDDIHYIYDGFTEKTGFHCAEWLIYYCIDNNLELPKIIMIHSMSEVGAKNIKSLFNTYYKINGITDHYIINDVRYDFILNKFIYTYYD